MTMPTVRIARIVVFALALLVLPGGQANSRHGSKRGRLVQAQQHPNHPPCSRKAWRGLTYATQSPNQKVDVHLPQAHGEPSPPLILWLHGGGWASSDRYHHAEVALAQLCRGYAVATVGYRLSWEAPFGAPLRDLKTVLRYLRAHAERFHIDGNRIAAWGVSAGGHLAALLAVTSHFPRSDSQRFAKRSEGLQAVVTWWAPFDFLYLDGPWPSSCDSPRNPFAPHSPEAKLLGCPIAMCPDAARAASPSTYVRSDAPPFLLMTGDGDCTVPPSQSVRFAEQLRLVGAEAELAIVPGAGHGTSDWWQSPTILGQVENFLDRYLRTEALELSASTQRKAEKSRSLL